MSVLPKGDAAARPLTARISAIWIALVAATLVTWYFGTDTRSHGAAATLVIVVTFVKIRLVGNYFMELREAPVFLRGAFEAYCVLVCSMILGLYHLL